MKNPMRNIPAIYLVLLFILLIGASSCAQLTSFQTGRTLGKGQTEITPSVSLLGVVDNPAVSSELGSFVLPFGDISLQHGISERFDLGLKVSTGLNAQLSGKYQFVGDKQSKSALSLGAGLSYQLAGEELVLRYHLPLYYSLHFSEKSAFYATPRYMLQQVRNDDNFHFLGLTAGYMHSFNDRLDLGTEFGLHRPFNAGNASENLMLLGVGLKYRFRKK